MVDEYKFEMKTEPPSHLQLHAHHRSSTAKIARPLPPNLAGDQHRRRLDEASNGQSKGRVAFSLLITSSDPSHPRAAMRRSLLVLHACHNRRTQIDISPNGPSRSSGTCSAKISCVLTGLQVRRCTSITQDDIRTVISSHS